MQIPKKRFFVCYGKYGFYFQCPVSHKLSVFRNSFIKIHFLIFMQIFFFHNIYITYTLYICRKRLQIGKNVTWCNLHPINIFWNTKFSKKERKKLFLQISPPVNFFYTVHIRTFGILFRTPGYEKIELAVIFSMLRTFLRRLFYVCCDLSV